jgi:hypothetical protein
MEKSNFLFILFLIFICSCSTAIQNQDSHRFILNNAAALNFDANFETFTPSLSEVILTDSLVYEFLKFNSPFNDESLRIKNYFDLYRQYLGVIDSTNRQLILVNTFCDERENSNARNMLVFGIGHCHFQLLVSLTERKCVRPTYLFSKTVN